MNKFEERFTSTPCEVLALATSGVTLGAFTPATANPWDNYRNRTERTIQKYRNRAIRSFVNNPTGRTIIRHAVPVERTVTKYGNRASQDLRNAQTPVQLGAELQRRSKYELCGFGGRFGNRFGEWARRGNCR